MLRSVSVLLALVLFIKTVDAQSLKQADSLYSLKKYAAAAPLYADAGRKAKLMNIAMYSYFSAGHCYSITKKKDSALRYMKMAVYNGWRSRALIQAAITSHRKWLKDSNWINFLNSIDTTFKVNEWSDTPKVEFVTTDMRNFLDAYDSAQVDTGNRQDIYKKYYFDKGTQGFQSFFVKFGPSIRSFVDSISVRKQYFAALDTNKLDVEAYKEVTEKNFIKMKDIFPGARFPKIYFLISGNCRFLGTAYANAITICVDCFSGMGMPTEEFTRKRLPIVSRNHIPYIIAHELIHIQQYNLATNDPSLLAAVLHEGMADFLGELISGKTSNEQTHAWVKGKENKVWERFSKQMFLRNQGKDWFGFSNNDAPDYYGNLGYWVGYMICKAYYSNADDKKQAVYDMLNIKDYKAFYEKSKVKQLIEELPE